MTTTCLIGVFVAAPPRRRHSVVAASAMTLLPTYPAYAQQSGVFVEEPPLCCAYAGYVGKSVMAEAATTATALVRRGCIEYLSLKLLVLNCKWHHARRTHSRGGAVSQASPRVIPARRVLSRFCYWQVNDSSKLMEQIDKRQESGHAVL